MNVEKAIKYMQLHGTSPIDELRVSDKEREPVPVTRNAERPLPDARRNVPGRSEG